MRQIFPLSPCLHFAFRTFVGSSLSSITCRLVFPLLSPCTRIWSQHLFLLLLLPRRKKARGRTEYREGRGTMPPTPAPPSRFLLFSPALPKEGRGGATTHRPLFPIVEREKGEKRRRTRIRRRSFSPPPPFLPPPTATARKKDTRKKMGAIFFLRFHRCFYPSARLITFRKNLLCAIDTYTTRFTVKSGVGRSRKLARIMSTLIGCFSAPLMGIRYLPSFHFTSSEN